MFVLESQRSIWTPERRKSSERRSINHRRTFFRFRFRFTEAKLRALDCFRIDCTSRCAICRELDERRVWSDGDVFHGRWSFMETIDYVNISFFRYVSRSLINVIRNGGSLYFYERCCFFIFIGVVAAHRHCISCICNFSRYRPIIKVYCERHLLVFVCMQFYMSLYSSYSL